MTSKVIIPRKKSCNNCFKSKLRCDLKRPTCTRCRNRDFQCLYASDAKALRVDDEPRIEHDSAISALKALAAETCPADSLNFTNVNLICTVDAHRIRVRWLESLLPSMDQRPKPYNPATITFAASILKSYPAMFMAGDRPPFIHWSQVAGEPPQCLANCMNIARMWVAQTDGSSAMVRDVIRQEMSRLYDKGSTAGFLLLAN